MQKIKYMISECLMKSRWLVRIVVGPAQAWKPTSQASTVLASSKKCFAHNAMSTSATFRVSDRTDKEAVDLIHNSRLN